MPEPGARCVRRLCCGAPPVPRLAPSTSSQNPTRKRRDLARPVAAVLWAGGTNVVGAPAIVHVGVAHGRNDGAGLAPAPAGAAVGNDGLRLVCGEAAGSFEFRAVLVERRGPLGLLRSVDVEGDVDRTSGCCVRETVETTWGDGQRWFSKECFEPVPEKAKTCSPTPWPTTRRAEPGPVS